MIGEFGTVVAKNIGISAMKLGAKLISLPAEMNDIVTELYSKYMEEIAFETAKRKSFVSLTKKY